MKVYPLHNTFDVEYDGMLTNRVYLHGKLQDDNGFDLCWIPYFGCMPPYAVGKYINEFEIDINGEIRKVNVYVWAKRKYEPFDYHGLVVYADDKEAIEYAENTYKIKPIVI